MKNILKSSLAMLGAFAISFTLVNAEEKADGKARPGGKGRPELSPEAKAKILERFDTDKDGKLDDTERAEARKSMGDRGGKGEPSPEMRAKMLERFDKDGDGELNEAERAEARKAMEAHGGKSRPDGKEKPKGDA